VWHSSVSADLG